jgi:hypothetical protein
VYINTHAGTVLAGRNEMTITERMQMISDALDSGKTVYISSATRVTKVTPKTAKKFAAINRPVFKVASDSLYMTSGNKYLCINYCSISVAS